MKTRTLFLSIVLIFLGMIAGAQSWVSIFQVPTDSTPFGRNLPDRTIIRVDGGGEFVLRTNVSRSDNIKNLLETDSISMSGGLNYLEYILPADSADSLHRKQTILACPGDSNYIILQALVIEIIPQGGWEVGSQTLTINWKTGGGTAMSVTNGVIEGTSYAVRNGIPGYSTFVMTNTMDQPIVAYLSGTTKPVSGTPPIFKFCFWYRIIRL